NVGVDDPEARRHGRESEESARDIDDVGRHLDPAILVHVEGRPGRIDPGGDGHVRRNGGIDDPEARRHGCETEKAAGDVDHIGRYLCPAVLVDVENTGRRAWTEGAGDLRAAGRTVVGRRRAGESEVVAV